MGNSSSSGSRHQDDTVDYGALVPQGVYTGPRDWNQAIVSQFIAQRKLAPFYRPLEDYEEEWDDDQILAARKEFPDPSGEQTDASSRTDQGSSASSFHGNSKSSHAKRPGSAKEFRPEAAIYRGAVECPICFLFYPRNINHSRCCDQAICTECFVQIKRAEPTTTHLVSEPAACPYCVQENFGIVYKPPLWRAGIGSEGHSPLSPADIRSADQPPPPAHKRRQRSYSAQSPEVVSIDQIRPDWEQKLAAVRAAVARRANRRIIMRQVGDRLIPVGIGRVHAEEGVEGGESGSGSRRRRARNAPPELAQYLGMGGQDLEELMLMEAMRLSLIDHEEQQRKEAEEKKKKTKEEAERTGGGQGSSSSNGGPSAAPSTSLPIPVSSSSSASNNLSAMSSTGSASSRSRTPEPSPPLNRTPPPFSTLNAALLTSGTASAFLSGSVAPAIPLPSGEASSLAASSASPQPSSTVTSSSTLGSGTYVALASSPDSGNAPLLGNGISSTVDATAKNQQTAPTVADAPTSST
ncbi:zf-C3HC4 type zinc finger protein [Coprinopsis sp. MPI-PUGE-AT-0042]|nr:zf-C3HC4 type zinc finger protein [Coprinopsis sp. MPI-PUGE-AT-0042]